ncbi:MAG TPA: 1-(5-phosphoribosyl)-5-[(5-phosphoribosylamino)methylideneamino] imidazole-4-carboxamide isomerase [Candidatus Scybalocola faecavium]|nr:1-(5-phosphoribosyl)-5-[(5-phosphoribosylamino)methylideneamino] imidazole-4-carboxamide isomerase [Candidatus Scybalocola faecavium]
MQLYPTIHIKNGKCFNPSSDPSDRQNIFTSSPVKLARIWEEAGASCIHIVDVDGAVMGYPVHEDLIREIIQSVNIPIQVGGGVRTIKDIDHLLNIGVRRVVCTTQAVQSNRFVEEAVASFGSDCFVAGIDAVNGMVAIEGRERLSKYNPIALINGMGKCGVATVIYTDIFRSALQKGPSIDNTRELVARTNVKIIYGGGIASLRDLEAISQLNVEGVIIASSLYNGNIDLKEAIDIFEKGMTGNEN